MQRELVHKSFFSSPVFVNATWGDRLEAYYHHDSKPWTTPACTSEREAIGGQWTNQRQSRSGGSWLDVVHIYLCNENSSAVSHSHTQVRLAQSTLTFPDKLWECPADRREGSFSAEAEVMTGQLPQKERADRRVNKAGRRCRSLPNCQLSHCTGSHPDSAVFMRRFGPMAGVCACLCLCSPLTFEPGWLFSFCSHTHLPIFTAVIYGLKGSGFHTSPIPPSQPLQPCSPWAVLTRTKSKSQRHQHISDSSFTVRLSAPGRSLLILSAWLW